MYFDYFAQVYQTAILVKHTKHERILSALISFEDTEGDKRQSKTRRGPVMTSDMDKDKPKPPIIRRPDVLKKLNADSLFMIERGLLGDLPDKLKPAPLVPSRAQSHELAVAKPSGFLSACLPIPDSPVSERVSSSDEDISSSPLKKSFSFRDRLSRISFFNKDKEKEKPKWKTIVEDEKLEDPVKNHGVPNLKPKRSDTKAEQDYKSNKRFWFFRSKELSQTREKSHRPVYTRSKSFEFLPRAAIEEEDEELSPRIKKNSSSYVFGSSDTMGEAWTSNESLEYIANIYHDSDDGVCLKSIKELASDLSNNSSTSIPTSGSSVAARSILKSESVENVFNEFKKAVELFSETYLSDCETYTKSKDLTIKQKRKSSSFTTLPSPKVVQVNKVSEASEDFKKELSKVLSMKNEVRTSRRGSVTDWFVLEDKVAAAPAVSTVPESNKYRRGKKKDVNRVRRISSTKYVSVSFYLIDSNVLHYDKHV